MRGLCFHAVIKAISFAAIFGSGWRKYGEKMEIAGGLCNN